MSSSTCPNWKTNLELWKLIDLSAASITGFEVTDRKHFFCVICYVIDIFRDGIWEVLSNSNCVMMSNLMWYWKEKEDLTMNKISRWGDNHVEWSSVRLEADTHQLKCFERWSNFEAQTDLNRQSKLYWAIQRAMSAVGWRFKIAYKRGTSSSIHQHVQNVFISNILVEPSNYFFCKYKVFIEPWS